MIMKRISYFILALFLAIGFAACNGDDSGDSGNSGDTGIEDVDYDYPDEEEEEDYGSAASGDQWVSLWGTGGIREEAGKGAKWVTRVSFGERVTYLGDEKEIESEDRTYVNIRLSDGQEGWMNKYLLAPNAYVAAFTKKSSVFNRPDFTTSTDKKFEVAEVVAVTKEQGEWTNVIGEQKKKKGWVQNKGNFTTDEVDIAVALMLSKANAESNPVKKKEIIMDILDNSAFESSVFYAEAEGMIESGAFDMPELSDGELMVTGNSVNIRSTPDTDSDNKLFQLNSGDICSVVEKGAQETIGGKTDNWYKIEYGGKEGWIFGSFTSRAR